MKLTSNLLKKLIKETMLQEEQEQELEKALEAAVAELPPEIVIAAALEEEPIEEEILSGTGTKNVDWENRLARAQGRADRQRRRGMRRRELEDDPSQSTFNKNPTDGIKPGDMDFRSYQKPGEYFPHLDTHSDRKSSAAKDRDLYYNRRQQKQNAEKAAKKAAAMAKQAKKDLEHKAAQDEYVSNSKRNIDMKIKKIEAELNSRDLNPILASSVVALAIGVLSGPLGAFLLGVPVGWIITKIMGMINKKGNAALQSQLQSARAEKSGMQEAIGLSEEQLESIVKEELAALMKERKKNG